MNASTDSAVALLPPLSGSGLSESEKDAIHAASDVLEEEANQLAIYMERTLKTELTLRTQEVVSIDALTPHRVVIAIRNEMRRLRGTATTLRGMLPPSPEDSDDE